MAELRARGFNNLGMWTRGVDTDLFTPGPRDRPRSAAADLHQRGADRRREESRGVSLARSARHQGRRSARGRRSANCGSAFPTRNFSGCWNGKPARRASRCGRRVRVSQQDRHVRRRAARGARLRRAGRGLSGDGAARRDRQPSGRRAATRICGAACIEALEHFAGRLPRLRADALVGEQRPAIRRACRFRPIGHLSQFPRRNKQTFQGEASSDDRAG